MLLLLLLLVAVVFCWHEIGFVWLSLGEPAGKFSSPFVRKGRASCIMVLAGEVCNCVHKLNYFNLRAREKERERERELNKGILACECVMHLHVNIRMCVCGRRDTGSFLFLNGARILKMPHKKKKNPSCRRL